MKIIYNIGVFVYFLLINVASFWNIKAKKWIRGRRNWRSKLEGVFSKDDKIIWIHCASLGEFEQGRPIIEYLKEYHDDFKILLTFYSPSGYEKRKHYSMVDHVCYLPLDNHRNAIDFLNIVPVSLVFFVKYEFWYHFLEQVSKRKIPLYLASGNFQRSQVFFRWYGKWYRKVFSMFSLIFVQDRSSAELLGSMGFDNFRICGDTRFDRVYDIASKTGSIKAIEAFSFGEKVIIAGSTWEKDHEIVRFAYQQLEGKCKLIIAPHEPNQMVIKKLREWYPDSILFSEIQEAEMKEKKVLIVDTIGHLSQLYKYACLAYIGGGFGKGIHNILEAAVVGLPILIGPNYQRFIEANELVSRGSAISISNKEEGLQWMEKILMDTEFKKKLGEISREYTLENRGATRIIVNEVFRKLKK